MKESDFTLLDMMFDSRPVEEFEKIFKSKKDAHDWGGLLHMCYCEESYVSVGGDEGYLDDPPIDHERLEYLKTLIAFLEESGIEEKE